MAKTRAELPTKYTLLAGKYGVLFVLIKCKNDKYWRVYYIFQLTKQGKRIFATDILRTHARFKESIGAPRIVNLKRFIQDGSLTKIYCGDWPDAKKYTWMLNKVAEEMGSEWLKPENDLVGKLTNEGIYFLTLKEKEQSS